MREATKFANWATSGNTVSAIIYEWSQAVGSLANSYNQKKNVYGRTRNDSIPSSLNATVAYKRDIRYDDKLTKKQ